METLQITLTLDPASYCSIDLELRPTQDYIWGQPELDCLTKFFKTQVRVALVAIVTRVALVAIVTRVALVAIVTRVALPIVTRAALVAIAASKRSNMVE